jgi:predicted permease
LSAGVFRDTVRGLRSWRRTPGSALLVILALGLSGGALLTLISVCNGLLWRELPVSHPEELVGVSGVDRQRPSWVSVDLPASLAAALEGAGDVLEDLAGFHRFESTAVINNTSQRLAIEGVSGRYFATIGVRPLLGRVVEAGDVDRAAPVATISFRCWQTRFGSDPGVIGRAFRLQGTLITVVGVAPSAFTGLQVGAPADVWVPTSLAPDLLDWPPALIFFNALVGRLRPGVTLQQAESVLEARWPSAREAAAAVVTPAQPQLRDYVLALEPRIESAARGFSPYGAYYRPALMWLLVICAIAIVLACANLSGLLLARWSTRERDLAVQAALGASRARLVSQVVGESLVLSVVAALLSVPFAEWSAKALVLLVWNQADYPPLNLSPDTRVLGVMVAVVGTVALCLSLLPASRVRSAQLTLRLGGRGSPGGNVARWGHWLAATQVALSVPLIVMAWMVAANLHHLQGVNTGFRSDEVIAVHLADQNAVAPIGDPVAYLRSLASTSGALPGISSAALASSEPVQIGSPRRRPVADADGSPGASAFVEQVSPGYFATLGVPLAAGRDFAWADVDGQPNVAIVSRRLARALFANDQPIGRRVRLSDENDRVLDVIGVVADANLAEPHQTNQMFLFTAFLQQSRSSLELQSPVLLLKSSLPPPAVVPSVQRAIGTLGRHDVLDAYPLQHGMDRMLIRERLMRLGSFYFAGLATLLVFVGLLAVLSFDVARRIPEIGLRMALGATPRDIRMLVIRQALVSAVAGLVVGVPCAFVGARLVVRFLALAESHDAVALGGATALILVITVLSVLIPLRRARHVSPVEALGSL